MSDYDRFTGVSHIGYPSYTENLYENLSSYLHWSFLQIGAFQNVRKSQYTYGQNPSRLRDTGNGTVWESSRRGWVWESGVYQTEPISISGVWVNNVLMTSGYQINYREGQVLFNTAVSGTVELEHSYRLYDIYQLDRERWFQEIIYGDWVSYSDNFMSAGSGAFDVLSKNRVNLPFVGIQIDGSRSFAPLQLGGGQICRISSKFYICGENSWQVSNAVDYISFQNDKYLKLFNLKFIQDSGAEVFNYNGTLKNRNTYKQLVDTFYWKNCRTSNVSVEQISTYPLYISCVNMDITADFPELP